MTSYDENILKKYKNLLNNIVKEEGISDIIVKMSTQIETSECKQKIKIVTKSNGYKKIYRCIDLFICILENNIDLKIGKMRELLIEKMKEIYKNYKSIRSFNEFNDLMEELQDTYDDLQKVSEDYDDLETDFTEYQEGTEQRYELLLQENLRLKELIKEKDEKNLKQRIIQLERENQNLKEVLDYNGVVDIDDINTDDELNYEF